MTRLYKYLALHKWVNVIMLLAYFLAVVLPHNEVGKFINGLFENFSRATYNVLIAGLCLIGLLGSLIYLNKRVTWTKIKVAYVLGILMALMLCFMFLMVINIEAVHFVQYCVLAILIFPLVGNYRETLMWVVLAGGLDELYQYLVLENTAFYYDFNDVVLDTVGGCIGLVYMALEGIAEEGNLKKWYKKAYFYIPITLTMLLCIAWALGYFALTKDGGDAYFTLFKRIPPDGFWFYPKGPYARFHILMPIPALIIISVLVKFYGDLPFRKVK